MVLETARTWRIYYADGSVAEDSDGPAVGEKARGVITILQSDDEVGWCLLSGSDYYVWREGRWWGCDINGLFDFLMDTGLVAFGRMVDNETFQTIFDEAQKDRSLADKDSFLPRRLREYRGST